MEFPYDMVDLDPDTNKELMQDFLAERTGFIKIGPQKYIMPAKYRQIAKDLYNFKLRPDDVWIATYPRSGTTVTQELMWLVANDFDYTAAAQLPLMMRFPFIEFNSLVSDKMIADISKLVKGNPVQEAMLEGFSANEIELLNETSSRRFIKTHNPFSLLPPSLPDTCKTVYVARNPKDVAVSFYYHNRLFRTHSYIGDFPKYWDYMERDLLLWAPYWEHIREGWELRNHPNVMFVFYEDVIKDMKGFIRKMATFLDKTATDEDVEKLADHLHIDNFRRNKSVNIGAGDEGELPGMINKGEQGFVRKGQTGSWKADFTPELSARADKWIAQNIAKIPGFKFPSYT